jgi:hypothetical protein
MEKIAMSFPKRHLLMALAAGALSLAGTGSARADPDVVGQAEIDHLLVFIGASSCTFVRNGTPGTATQARDHLAGKYQFAKGRISSAEEFIQNLATQSSVSGQPYVIRCGKNEQPAGVWLVEELRRYRKVAQATR